MDKVFEKLKQNFGLRGKHILILEAIKDEKLNAKQICDKTSIPQGRIYAYLNDLLENKIINRTPKKPYVYSISNLNKNVINFMKQKMDVMVEAQSEVMDMMKGPGIEQVEIVNNSKKFTEVHLRMITESKVLKYISLHTSLPYVMYPFEFDDFIKLRRAVVKNRPTITFFDHNNATLIHKTYLDAFKKGKKMIVVFEKQSWENHLNVVRSLGREFFDRWKRQVLDNFEKYNIQVYIIDEYLPMQVDVNERRVNFSVRHLGIITGVVLLSNEVTKFYNQFFDQTCKRAKLLKPILIKAQFKK